MIRKLNKTKIKIKRRFLYSIFPQEYLYVEKEVLISYLFSKRLNPTD
jgi:hypothetical protein